MVPKIHRSVIVTLFDATSIDGYGLRTKSERIRWLLTNNFCKFSMNESQRVVIRNVLLYHIS